MTIRNFLPGFGMRTVAALAVAAAVVVAALLTVGSPASAQGSDDGDEIYSATMTVGANGSIRGYYNVGAANDYGSLTRTGVSSPRDTGSDYSLRVIIDTDVGNDRLVLGFNRILHDADVKAMRLHIGGRTYDFDAASYAAPTLNGTVHHTYTWNFTPTPGRFGWAAGDSVALKITALPIITIEAVTTTVEYGGNNNAAESTAEFKFTRTGSTDKALSFEVSNGGIFGGETATRTFKAGESSFSNFHWAIDVDTSTDPHSPLCVILWALRTGDDYVLGTPSSATVTVEGPGTTCMATM